MYNIVLGLGILIGLFLIGSCACSYYKLPEGYEAAGPSQEDLELRLGETFNTVVAKGKLFAGVLILAWCLEVWFTSHLAALDRDTIFAFRPEVGVWVFAAIIGAFGIGTLAARLWIRRALGEHAEDYERYCNLKTNVQGEPISKVHSGTTIIVSLILIVLASNCRTAVTSTGITVNPLISFGARHRSWSEVDRLVHAKAIVLPGGTQVERSVWQIRFKDGSLWSSDHAPGSYSDRDYFLFITHATIQSGAPIEEVALLQDADR